MACRDRYRWMGGGRVIKRARPSRVESSKQKCFEAQGTPLKIEFFQQLLTSHNLELSSYQKLKMSQWFVKVSLVLTPPLVV